MQSDAGPNDLPRLGLNLALAKCTGAPNQNFTFIVSRNTSAEDSVSGLLGKLGLVAWGRLATIYERVCVAACSTTVVATGSRP